MATSEVVVPAVLAFVEQIARMTMDGEEIDGAGFIMENDHAVSSLNELIESARSLLGPEMERPFQVVGIDRRDGVLLDDGPMHATFSDAVQGALSARAELVHDRRLDVYYPAESRASGDVKGSA